MTTDRRIDGEPGRRSRRIQFISVVLLGAVLRLIWLDGVPPGINQDEAIHAYDAYCLLETGMDHAGRAWPIFVHANGVYESHSAPFVYLLIPFQAILGMNVWSTRLPAALLGILTIPLVYSLVRRWYGDRAAILAALFLAISPWHIHLCRLAFEVSICPFLFTLGLWLFVKAVLPEGERPPAMSGRVFAWLGLSGLTLGLTLWTYNAMRVFVPLILLVGFAVYFRDALAFARRPRGVFAIIAFVFGLLVGVAPFVWACFTTPDRAWGRAGANFIVNQAASGSAAVLSVIQTYAMHLGPSFLFLTGDTSLAQHMPGHGQLFLFDAPLLLLGLYRLIRRRGEEKAGLFLLAWLLVAPVPAAITQLEVGHALRAAAALPAYQILSALGLDWLLAAALRRSRTLFNGTVALAAVVLTVSAAVSSYLFFHDYAKIAGRRFNQHYRPLVAEILRRQADYDLVIVAPGESGQVGTIFLFWSQTPPRKYFDSAKNIWEGPEWDVLLQMGKYLFVSSEALPQIIPQLPSKQPTFRVLVAETPDVPVRGAKLFQVDDPPGQPALVLYDVRVERGH